MFCVLKIFAIALVFLTHKACSACNHTQYKTDEKCCSMCSPGTHLQSHCQEDIDTVCLPCASGTFSDKPNFVIKCRPCTACDEGLGLKAAKDCTASSDTVCGVLEGNHCIDLYEGGCRAAQKHTTCKPGQFITHLGTDLTDTMCENCPENSHSDGFSTFCTPFKEEPKGLPTDTPEDRVSHSDHTNNSRLHSIIVIIIVVAIVIMIAVVVAVVLLKRKNSSLSDGQTQASRAENGNMLLQQSDAGNPKENGSPGDKDQQEAQPSLHSCAESSSSNSTTGE